MKNKLKVLFLTNIPSPYRVAFFGELGKLCNLTVLYEKRAASDRDVKWKLEQAQQEKTYAEVFLPAVYSKTDNAFCPKATTYLGDRTFDIIVLGVYSTPTGMYAIHYMKRHHITYWISCDGGMIREDSVIKKKIKTYFLSGAAGYLSSGKISDKYLCHYGAEQGRIHRYPFTSLKRSDILETPITREQKQRLRIKLGMTEDNILISVGQFIYRKGYDILLGAADKLSRDIGIYLIGSDPTEEYLELQKEYKLKNVHFISFMKNEELKEYYQAADLFVLPTREDIWGLVINEAMANALPVITTDKCVAGLELVSADNGAIVQAEDMVELRNAISGFYELSEEKKMKMAKASLEKIKPYNIENMAQIHAKELFMNKVVVRIKY